MTTEITNPAAQYRAALLDRGGRTADDFVAHLSAIEAAILADRGEKAGRALIEAIHRDVDHEIDISEGRRQLDTALTDAEKASLAIGSAIAYLSSDNVYDIEIAEGDTAALNAALTGIKLNLAALRHLTRHATGSEA